MNPRVALALKVIGYPLAYLGLLVVGLYVTFPTERVRERALAEFAAKRPLGDGTLEIDEVDTYWGAGLELTGVRLTLPAPPPGEDGKQEKPRVVSVEEAHCRWPLWRMLSFTLAADCTLKGFGGEVVVHYVERSTGRSIEAELNGISVADLPPVVERGLPLSGALSGTVSVLLPEGKWAKAEGTLDLTVTDMAFGDGKTKLMDTIALPRMDIGEFAASLELTEGRLTVKKLGASGKDVDVSAEGKVKLRDPIGSSLAELGARYKFSDKYMGKSDTTKAIFGDPGSKVPGLMDLDPKVKRAKRPDGFYGWRLTGPLSHPIFEANPSGALPSGPTNVRPMKPIVPKGGGAPAPDDE